jgi:zeaxanthin glucosyltransferase
MTHFGLVFPAAIGHINSLLPLGVKLQECGHRVTCFSTIDADEAVAAAGLTLDVIGLAEFPKGRAAKLAKHIGELKGLPALRYTVEVFCESTKVRLRDLPERIRELNVEALIYDRVLLEGTTIAAQTQIPIVTFFSAIINNPDPAIPLFFKDRLYAKSPIALFQNYLDNILYQRTIQPIGKIVNDARQKWGLAPIVNEIEYFSAIAQISQTPREFEYPRSTLPDYCHFTGPFHTTTSRSKNIEFPWELLDDRPLIYASLGTLQNQLLWIFETIADAGANLPYQLVISFGRSDAVIPPLKGNPIAVPFAPQLELLDKASLVITHAGLNTTMECLSRGVPLIAIPLANDQPGVAGRIAWNGCGEKLSVKKLTAERLLEKINLVMGDNKYRDRARYMQSAIQRSGGVEKAVKICEIAANTRKPVLPADIGD